jgi:Ca2+-binding RTX toxin-like protein
MFIYRREDYGVVLQFRILSGLFVAASIFMMVSSNPEVLAAVISCVPSVPCDGTNDNDTMNGSNQDDGMKGLEGNDTMYGNGGDDGGLGNEGDDRMYGGDGDDGDMHGGAGDDRMYGGDGNDGLRGSSDDDFISGQDGSDDLTGDEGDDTMNGGPGDDSFEGREGNDNLNGGKGNDKLIGDNDNAPGTGADVINGGAGNDKLYHGRSDGERLKSDGFKDTLDCGPGQDEAWINAQTDGDTATNCETVHKYKELVPPSVEVPQPPPLEG